MGFKNFRFNIIFRSIILSVTLLSIGHLVHVTDFIITIVVLSLLAIVQVVALISYVEKSNKDITNFLESIRYSDFTRTFQSNGKGGTFDRLSEAFNNVVLEFQKLRAEKEEHFFYLQNIIQHIGIAIVAYRSDGSVEMINNAGKRLFQISGIKNIKELQKWSKSFVDLLDEMKAGENTLIKVQDGDDLLQLAVYATEFKINDRTITLVSIKNIQAELEEQEMEAWQKLIRVLTHEIMNSIAPISSLTSTTNLMVDNMAQTIKDGKHGELELETVQDIQAALQTINKRSTGLIHFVETYRNLTRIPKPNFAIFPIKNLFTHISELLRNDLKANNIDFHFQINPESIVLTADEQLLEQVLLNMLKNAIQALQGLKNGKIRLKAYLTPRGRTVIQVIDNGPGLLEEVKDKVFIPFFTTKREGSGIGLSLSRQIIRQHNGTINVQSEPGVETCFTITL